MRSSLSLRAGMVMAAMVVAVVSSSLAGERPVAVERVNLLSRLGRELPANTLKLFRAAIDGEARRLYVSGILTSHLAVLDLEGERWAATIDTGLPQGYKYLYADAVNHLVFVYDGSHGTLARVDPTAGTVGPQVAVPAQTGSLLADGVRGLIYLLTPEQPSLRAYREDTLELAWSSDEVSSGSGQPVMDPDTGDLLLLDMAREGPEGRIYRFDPGARALKGTIVFDLPSGQRAGTLLLDPVGHRLVVVVGQGEIRTLGMGGETLGAFRVPAELELQNVALDPDRGRVLAVAVGRPVGDQVSGIVGHLLVVDLATMELVRDIHVAKKPHSLAVDPRTGIAWMPNGDASTVWRVDPGTGEVQGRRLGDSAEQVVAVQGGRRLVMNSRLGGSYLMAWDTSGDRLDTFETGTWPIPVRAVPELGLLLVLNAWDGTLTVLPEEHLEHPLATIRLALPPGTTDRLPDLAVDPIRRLAFAAFPEFGAIAVADLGSLAPDGVITVPGALTGDTGGGPGQLMLAVDPAGDRLLAVEAQRGRAVVFSIATREVLETASFDSNAVGEQTTDLLFADPGRGTCWVGRLELSMADGHPTGRKLPRGDRVFAVDEDRGVYWVAGEEQGEDLLVAVDRETLEVSGAWPVGRSDGLHSSFLFVPPGRIWRARLTEVDLTGYELRPGPRHPTGRAGR